MPPWEVRKIIDPKVPKGSFAMLVPNKGNPSKGSQNFTHLPEVTACITSPLFSVPNTGRNPHQSFAASLFAGELGFGSVKRDWKKARRSRGSCGGSCRPLRVCAKKTTQNSMSSNNKQRHHMVEKNKTVCFMAFLLLVLFFEMEKWGFMELKDVS